MYNIPRCGNVVRVCTKVLGVVYGFIQLHTTC